jgi:hypothetical protein
VVRRLHAALPHSAEPRRLAHEGCFGNRHPISCSHTLGSGYFQLPGPPLGSQPLLTTASAGTVFITDYPIMHRRAASSRPCKRDLLKYMYWRTQPPARDWASTRDSFDFHKADWRSFYGAGGPMENVEAVSRRT